MIRRKGEFEEVVRNNVCGGNGSLFVTKLLQSEEIYHAGRGISKVVIPAGGSCGEHLHTEDCEAYYILKGKALVTDNGCKTELCEGDLLFCDIGGTHGIENITENDLEYIAVVIYGKDKGRICTAT